MKYAISMILLIGICACGRPKVEPGTSNGPKTIGWPNTGMWLDQDDFVNAQRGMLSQLDPLTIRANYHLDESTTGPIVWNLTDYAEQMISSYQVGNIYPMTSFPAPDDTKVNPSLWRNSVLNSIHGVFEVVPSNIYQVRGYDLSNITMVRASETSGTIKWIVIDPLLSAETAYAAWKNFVREYNKIDTGKTHLIQAVIFTHSHADHYGGIDGLKNFLDTQCEIWAPEGFAEHAISENVIVGNAMSRRASYMYGAILPKGTTGQVDGGLGKTSSTGGVGVALPTHTVTSTWVPKTQGQMVAGLEVCFQNVPGR